MNYTSGFPDMEEVFFSLCKSVDSAVSLGAWLRYKYSEHLQLAEMEVIPANYQDGIVFELDYLVVSYLSKWKGLATGLDLEDEALRRFTSSEVQCQKTNERIIASRKEGIDPSIASYIYTAQRKIAKLLGEFSWSKVEPWFGWGPGATRSIPRRRAFTDTKMCEVPISVTPDAKAYMAWFMATDLHWSAAVLGVPREDLTSSFSWLDSVFLVKEDCVIDTVPKNAKTHRVIAKEATANGFLQKGFGGFFRKQLKRVGIDLDNQAFNQQAAKAAYEEGLATLDLKAASDTVALELVYELLPVDWALALDSVRSPSATMPNGETITLQKFSSMGNGFTFELETLIFWALTGAVNQTEPHGDRKKVLVYGDDIICSQSIASEVVRVLAFAGFQTNEEKSFTSGNFYESCGKHYFRGYEVTPVYQKERIDENPMELIRAANRLIRYALRTAEGNQLRKELSGPWHCMWRRSDWTIHYVDRRKGSRKEPLRSFQLPLGVEGDDGWLLPASLFTVRSQDANFGLRCRVLRPVIGCLPAFDDAFYAWEWRKRARSDGGRGQTQHPPDLSRNGPLRFDMSPAVQRAMPTTSWEGTVDVAAADGQPQRVVPAARWVMPSGNFGQDW